MRGGFDFIRRLYDAIIVPPAVLREVAYGYETTSAYLDEYAIARFVQTQAPSASPDLPELSRLHEGETQAIRLALELDMSLLIEERAGRRVAREVGLSISGIAGQIVKASRQQIIPVSEARKKLDELLENRRINETIYDRLLAALRETL